MGFSITVFSKNLQVELIVFLGTKVLHPCGAPAAEVGADHHHIT